jgi:hypothetical protein
MRKIRGMMAAVLDDCVAKFPAIEDLYLPLRAQIVLAKYRWQREHSAAICQEKGLVYSETDTIRLARKRLQERGYTPGRRRLGEVHTFAFIARLGWHGHLYPDLYELGPTTEFDYVAMGFDNDRITKSGIVGQALRRDLNRLWYETLVEAHRRHPVDWIFVYASGNHILSDTVRRIQEELGVPLVIMCLDAKQSWEGAWLGEQRGLQVDLAPVFDLSWTSSRVTAEWYMAEGGRPLYLPEGCDAQFFHPLAVTQDVPVSFIGQRYGFRGSVIRYLVKKGVDVRTFGRGWNNAYLSQEQVVEVACRSIVNLGMGGIGPAEYLTNVKGRDFEIPCTGGGMYLTSFNPDLSLHFEVGREIVCYRSRDEMLELIRYYLLHPEEVKRIAEAGRRRCLREHRWLHRYIKVCQVLGVLDDSVAPTELVERNLDSS